MAINQLGVVAPVPQQFEALITSSQTWQVPIGVKTVEYLIAGGGGNQQARAGVGHGLYNVQGKSSLAIVIGAEASGTGVTGGTTTVDGQFYATGGRGEGYSASSYGGDFIDAAVAVEESIDNSYFPIPKKTSYLTGTSDRMMYFAAHDGHGISISQNGSEAMVTSNSGSSWTAVNSITGDATTFASIVHSSNMLMHHNDSYWILFRQDGTYYAASEDQGLNWVVFNYAATIRDMIMTGSNHAVLVGPDRHAYTSNIMAGGFSNTNSTRGDVIIRAGENNIYTLGNPNRSYQYSTNGGSTWGTSNGSFSSFSNASTINRFVKTSSANAYRTAVISQAGKNSSSVRVSLKYDNNTASIVAGSYNFSSDGNSSSTSSTSNYGGTWASPVWLMNVQKFDENQYGVFMVTYPETSGQQMVRRNDLANYGAGFLNNSDGSLQATNPVLRWAGNAQVSDISRYIYDGSGSPRKIFADSGVADGFIYSVMSYQGHGSNNSSLYSTQYNSGSDAAGNVMSVNYGSSGISGLRVEGGGIDGWGRTSGQLNGFGYGGAGQNGAVRLRWVA